jgi:hypothetical protein
MTREIIGALAIALVVAIALLVYRSNRSLRKKQEQVTPAPQLISALNGVSGYYVATVYADGPLNKFWGHGLGARGQAQFAITPNGLAISRDGEASFLIPSKAISAIGHQSATIDKAVEKDGLLLVDWTLGETKLTTVIRIVEQKVRKDFEASLRQLIGAHIG